MARTKIKNPQIESGIAEAYVATLSSGLSAGPADISGSPGPAVTVTIGPSGKCKVSLYCNFSTVLGGYVGMLFAASGANTISPADEYGIFAITAGGRYGATFVLTGLTPGVTTFTAKYNSGSTSSAVSARRLWVEPL
jgi:hypothetical protein